MVWTGFNWLRDIVNGNGTSVSVKDKEFLGYVNDYHFLKKDTAP
jgi:hypothetical protein